MAGNIQWFRWHHGSVTDPKFKLVAHKAKQSLATVIAVWAFLLEQASASDERGAFGDVDCESLDCLLGLDDGATAAIIQAMQCRGLVENGSVSAWEKRQPKRERVDENSTERSRAFREKQRHATPDSSDKAPCNAMQRQKTPREEESREENINPPSPPSGGARPKREKPRSRCSPDFAPSEAGAGVARSHGLDVQAELRRFIDHHTAVGSTMADWQAAWRTWVSKAVEFGRGRQQNAAVPKRGSDEYLEANRDAAWWREAGFPSVYDAIANRCWHDNADQFRDGHRVEVSA